MALPDYYNTYVDQGNAGNPAKSPYFNERSYRATSYIPPAQQANTNTPGLTLPGIDAASIYGKNSPAAQVGYSPKGTSGISAGQWAGAGVAAAGIGLDAANMASQRFNFGNIAQSQTDSNSAPVYTAGQLSNQVSGAHPHGAQAGEIGSAVAKGAAAGTQVLPGWGTAIGAVYGLASSVIGGAIRKNQQQTEKDRAYGRVAAAQSLYNKQDEDYRRQQNQLYNYYNQNNAAGREYNIYRTHFA
jgi:hypothetical protein